MTRTIRRHGPVLPLAGLLLVLLLGASCDDESLTLFTFDVDFTSEGRDHFVVEGTAGCSLIVQTFTGSETFTIDLDDEDEFNTRALDFITRLEVKHLEVHIDQSASKDLTNDPDEDGADDDFAWIDSITVEVVDGSDSEVVAEVPSPGPGAVSGFTMDTPGANFRDFITSDNELTFRVTVSGTCPPDDVYFHITDDPADGFTQTDDGGLTIEVGAGIRGD